MARHLLIGNLAANGDDAVCIRKRLTGLARNSGEMVVVKSGGNQKHFKFQSIRRNASFNECKARALH